MNLTKIKKELLNYMSIEKIVEKLSSPETLRPFRPLPFWSWNDRLDEKRLTEQIEWMHSCGIGGFFMHARGGLITEYLGEEWMSCCDACCEKAAELGMDAYMYDENGWPSGFAGGKLLEDENNRDRSLYFDTGDFNPDAFVSYKINGAKLERANAPENGARYLNVYQKISVSTADILNPEVVEKFLDITHRKYKARYGKEFPKKLKGFFTDEPQYFRWATAYTPVIEEYFKETYGEDVKDGLGLLFAEKEGYEEFRYKYWNGMQALMLKNFAKKIYDFCEENNVLLTGHYVEETSLAYQMLACGGTMPFYAYEHIPGIDWLGRGTAEVGELSPKQVGSVSAQTGRNRVLTESFGCCGWDVTPRELKRILDWQFLGGVNVVCHHLLPSSEYGQRKRDYPQHYTPLNAWINKHFREFNDNYTRLGALIGNSEEVANVCLLHPIKSAYCYFRRDDKNNCGLGELDKTFFSELELLASNQIPHHYADETLLATMGSVKGNKFVCGKCAYEYLIIPTMNSITASTLALVKKFVQAGGKLLLLGKSPALVEGKKADVNLKSNCTFEQIKAAQPYHADNSVIRTTMRRCKEGDFVFAVNPSQKEQKFTLSAGKAKSVRILNTQTLEVSRPLPLSRTLRAGQSAILFPCPDEPEKETVKPLVKTPLSGKVVKASPNTMPLDSARYALDGEDFGENTSLIKIFALLLEKRYKGKLRLKYEFESNIVPKDIKLYAEDMNTEKVEVNGAEVFSCGTLKHEPMVHEFEVANLVKKGKNEIVITLNYYQDENVYFALFGEGVTESLRNCMVYNTSLESVYLAGSFGVYPVNPQNGQTERTMICDGFIIDEPKTTLTSLVSDGYATFAGELTLEKEIEFGKEAVLELGGRWQTAEIEINGKTKTLLFDTATDVSDMIREGKNTVRITVATSLRNLMGPHHFAPVDDPEPVGPEHFNLSGSWKNGESPLLRPTYSLVKN